MQKSATSLYTDGTYLNANSTWHVEDSLWKAEQIMGILADNSVTPRTLGEVGCGAGEVLRQMSLKLPDTLCHGYELSPQAHELCKTRESERVHYHLADLLAAPETFDCLLCVDVFEHVEDYFGFLRQLRGKAELKVFHIPLDISAWSVAKGFMLANRLASGHIQYFTRESALETLKSCGYQIVDERYTRIFDHYQPTSIPRKAIKLMQRLLYRLSPHLEVRLLGGCSLLVLAR